MSAFVAGVIIGGLFFGWLGLRYGGARALLRLGSFEYRERRRRSGLD